LFRICAVNLLRCPARKLGIAGMALGRGSCRAMVSARRDGPGRWLLLVLLRRTQCPNRVWGAVFGWVCEVGTLAVGRGREGDVPQHDGGTRALLMAPRSGPAPSDLVRVRLRLAARSEAGAVSIGHFGVVWGFVIAADWTPWPSVVLRALRVSHADLSARTDRSGIAPTDDAGGNTAG